MEHPDLLTGDDYGEWSYYVFGHDEENLWTVDDPEELLYEKIWMRRVAWSEVKDEIDFLSTWDDVQPRDSSGRFTSRAYYIECSENEVDAVPYMGVRYKPI